MACFLLARVLQTAGGSEQALPLLDEARQRFEAVARKQPGQGAERMASVCLTEQGSCLRYLGRLDEAAAAYEESILRAERLDYARQVAVGKGQLGAVRMDQRRYPEALAAYAEARERFTQLEEPGSVAVSWHQTGMVYQVAGQPEAAEAKGKAIACYLAYRRDGGENHDTDGRICLAVTQSLRAGNPAEAASLLQQLAANPNAARLLTFIRALQAIVTGSRDRTLADAPDLDYTTAAEILFLIETLEQRP